MTSPLPNSQTQIVKRLYILAAFLAIGFSLIWFLPKSGEMRLSRLARHLPMKVGSMVGYRGEISEEELKILAKDTEFERLQYVNSLNPTQPPIEASVVFSGKDLNNSIHRPERCLRAQGWNFIKQRKITVRNALPDGSDIPFREIVCEKPVKLKNGKTIKVTRVQYYTFFGHTAITEDHYGRTLQDMKDRLFKGYDQQWAYATFSMPVNSKDLVEAGLVRPGSVYSLEDSEKMLKKFIKQLLPVVVDRKGG